MKKMLLLFVLMSVTVFAQPGKMRDNDDDDDNEMMMPHSGGMMMERLKLTDDQEKQFTKLHDELQKQMIDTRSKVQSLRVDLKSLFRDEKADQGKIESTIQSIGKLQTDMKIQHVNFWFNVNKMLTAEQQKMWKEHRAMAMEKGLKMRKSPMGKRMHRMRRHFRDDE